MKLPILITINAMSVVGIAWSIYQYYNLQQESWTEHSHGVSYQFSGKDCIRNILNSRYCLESPEKMEKFNLAQLNVCLYLTLGTHVCIEKMETFMVIGLVCSLVAAYTLFLIPYEKRRDYLAGLRDFDQRNEEPKLRYLVKNENPLQKEKKSKHHPRRKKA